MHWNSLPAQLGKCRRLIRRKLTSEILLTPFMSPAYVSQIRQCPRRIWELANWRSLILLQSRLSFSRASMPPLFVCLQVHENRRLGFRLYCKCMKTSVLRSNSMQVYESMLFNWLDGGVKHRCAPHNTGSNVSSCNEKPGRSRAWSESDLRIRSLAN